MVVKKKKFDIIFANGCSYVQGCGLNGDSLPSIAVKNVKNRFSELNNLLEKYSVKANFFQKELKW